MTRQLTTLGFHTSSEKVVSRAKTHLIEREIDEALLDVWNEKVNELEGVLRIKEKQLQTKASETEKLVEEMTYLEEKNKVQARYLFEQNRQLIQTEYIYSSQLKSPIADILGLVHQLYGANQSEEVQHLANLLEKNTHQLEELVKRLEKSSSIDV